MKFDDIYTKILMLKSGIMNFEDWRREMLEWAKSYNGDTEGKELLPDTPMVDGLLVGINE